jgi:subtilisin family serine protease
MPTPGSFGGAELRRVAVIDSGVDSDHPCFTGSRVTKRALRPSCVGVEEVPATAPTNRHGTAVAGLVAMAGPVDLLSITVLDEALRGRGDVLARAIKQAAAMDAELIVASMVTHSDRFLPELYDAVRTAVSRGSRVLAPVQGDAESCLPAALPGVIRVSACERNPRMPPVWHSEFECEAFGGPQFAPSRDGGMGFVRGVSFAVPRVAASLVAPHEQRQLHIDNPAPKANARDVGALTEALCDLAAELYPIDHLFRYRWLRDHGGVPEREGWSFVTEAASLAGVSLGPDDVWGESLESVDLLAAALLRKRQT